jgi:glycosyltransferase involved in cell wall biosynthesis
MYIGMPEISAVITTHNRLERLQLAIDSVRNQSRKPSEIIVVDDGSTDGTTQWLARQAGIKSIFHPQTKGISATRNAGIAAANGEWVAFLDDDDTWLPNKLGLQIESLQQNPDHRLCHGDEIWVRNGKRVNAMDKHRKQGGWIYPYCLPLCVISPSAVLIHQELLNDVGLFDISLPACEDYDLWLRICVQEPVLYIDKPLITKYGGHEDQLSRKYWGMDRFRIQALEKMLSDHSLSDENRMLTLEMLSEKLSIYIQGARKRGKHEEASEYQHRLNNYQAQLRQSHSGHVAVC